MKPSAQCRLAIVPVYEVSSCAIGSQKDNPVGASVLQKRVKDELGDVKTMKETESACSLGRRNVKDPLDRSSGRIMVSINASKAQKPS